MLAHCLTAHQRLSMRAEFAGLFREHCRDLPEPHTWDLSDLPIEALPPEFRAQALSLKDRLSTNNVSKMVADLVRKTAHFGIRDWSKEPYGAGCHAWKPGTKSWEVRERMKAFGLFGHPTRSNIHICGEAFSGYQGFIEGALQTASDVVSEIKRASSTSPRKFNG